MSISLELYNMHNSTKAKGYSVIIIYISCGILSDRFPYVFLTDLNANVVHHGKRFTFDRIFYVTGARQLLGILVHILFPCIRL